MDSGTFDLRRKPKLRNAQRNILQNAELTVLAIPCSFELLKNTPPYLQTTHTPTDLQLPNCLPTYLPTYIPTYLPS